MSLIQPFRAYRPAPELAARVASVPYDVINTAEARQLAAGNPYSFLHVCRPEIDLPEGIDEHEDRVYATGAANLKKFIASGILAPEAGDSLYVYQQRMGDHIQAGVVALCSVREYEQNLIRKHEFTRRDKEDDRTRHVSEQNANAEPVFLTYRAQANIDAIVDAVRLSEPLYDITTPDDIGHTVWRIADPAIIAQLVALFRSVEALYIADGHHRTASAARYGEACRARNPHPTGNEPYESFMAVVFPHNQLKIFDYNRLAKDLNGLSPEQFLAKVGENFEVTSASSRQPSQPASFGMFLQGKWYALKARAGSYPQGDPIKRLDVSILQENLLSPVLGIHDPRTDKRVDFVGGIRGMDELERRVREGFAVAFSLYPTSLDQLIDVADAGQVMPPKSTWFEPKLRSGLLVRLYQ
jgi:uncharacterized protein (DUF1015 family)